MDTRQDSYALPSVVFMIHDSLPGFNLVDYRPSGFISKYKGKIRHVKQIAIAIDLTGVLDGDYAPHTLESASASGCAVGSLRSQHGRWTAMIKATVTAYRGIVQVVTVVTVVTGKGLKSNCVKEVASSHEPWQHTSHCRNLFRPGFGHGLLSQQARLSNCP